MKLLVVNWSIKIAMMFFAKFISCINGIGYVFITSKLINFFVNVNANAPFLIWFMKGYTNITRNSVSIYFGIKSILLICTFPKIGKSVICSDAIFMVNVFRNKSVNIKPYNAMQSINSFINRYCFITMRSANANFFTSKRLTTSANCSGNYSSIWIVMQKRFNIFLSNHRMSLINNERVCQLFSGLSTKYLAHSCD